MRRAGNVWRVAVPEIAWKDVLLEEAGEREHVLSAEEEGRLFAALRPDYHAMVRFALFSTLSTRFRPFPSASTRNSSIS